MIRAYLFTRIISVKNYICVRFNSSSRDGLYFYYNMLLLNCALFSDFIVYRSMRCYLQHYCLHLIDNRSTTKRRVSGSFSEYSSVVVLLNAFSIFSLPLPVGFRGRSKNVVRIHGYSLNCL